MEPTERRREVHGVYARLPGQPAQGERLVEVPVEEVEGGAEPARRHSGAGGLATQGEEDLPGQALDGQG